MTTEFRPLIAGTLVVLLSAFGWSSFSIAQSRLDRLVSLVQLIANPTAFDGKQVAVEGYVVLEFENKKMYLSEADAKHSISRNGVWLAVDDAIYANRSRFHRRYVLVEGTFNARQRGHLGLSSGEIENITRFELID